MADIPEISAGGNIAIPQPVEVPMRPSGAAEGLQDTGDEVMRQAQALGEHFADMRRYTQFNQGHNEYGDGRDQILFNVSRDPKFKDDPVAAQQEVQTRLDDLRTQVLQKYPYANRDGTLSKNIDTMSRSAVRTIILHTTANQEESAKDEYKASFDQAVNTAVNAADPKDRMVAFNNQMQLIDVMQKKGLVNPGEADLDKQNLKQRIAQGQFQNLALRDPGQVLAMTLPPDGLGPKAAEILEQTQRIAIDQLEAPSRMMAAQLAAHRGQTEQAIAKAAAAGQPITAQLETARKFRDVSELFYEAHAGHAFRPQGDEALAQMLDEGIDGGHVDRTTVLSAMANPNGIDAKQGAVLESKIQARDRDRKTALGSAKYEYWGKLEGDIRADEFFMEPGTITKAHNAFMARMVKAKTPEDVELIYKDLKNEFAPDHAKIPASPAKTRGMKGFVR